MPSSPLDLLIENERPLALSPQQRGELDLIRDQLATTNEPLITRLMTLRSQWQRERRAARRGGQRPDAASIARIRADAALARTRIQENNRGAMRAVNRLLSPAQRKRLRSIVSARRPLNPANQSGRGIDAGAGH